MTFINIKSMMRKINNTSLWWEYYDVNTILWRQFTCISFFSNFYIIKLFQIKKSSKVLNLFTYQSKVQKSHKDHKLVFKVSYLYFLKALSCSSNKIVSTDSSINCPSKPITQLSLRLTPVMSRIVIESTHIKLF